MIKIGSKAPSFNLIASDGKKYSLKDFSGKKIVLYFYPKDDTSGCTKEACDFRDNIDSFKKKIQSCLVLALMELTSIINLSKIRFKFSFTQR